MLQHQQQKPRLALGETKRTHSGDVYSLTGSDNHLFASLLLVST